MSDLRAPFPYFGGKSRAAALVWERFGTPVNYVEPFFGSGAVLLSCPEKQRPRVETVNDLSCFLANFWRATKAAPDAVAEAADHPVVETDLHSRHRWLLAQATDLRAKLDADPDYFDARIAGWWVWGASAWIGSGWCEEGMREPSRRMPALKGNGGTEKRGSGRPGYGDGVHGAAMREPSRQLPHLGGGDGSGAPRRGVGVNSATNRTRLYDLFVDLSERLRHVRVTCGDFERILTDAVTHRHGLTAVFLDPPYEGFEGVYGAAESVAARAREWALKAGERPDMRIALCGYEGEHEMPGWECVSWRAKGGYANAGDGSNLNRHRERVWFSPACLRPGVDTGQIDLFAGRST